MKKHLIYLSFVGLLACNACTDLNETLYDKVTMDSYGKNNSEVQTIVGGAYATLRAMVPILLKAIRSIVSPHVNMYSSPPPAQVMRHVSLLVVQTGTMEVAISSYNSTHGTLITPLFSRFGDTISLEFRRLMPLFIRLNNRL